MDIYWALVQVLFFAPCLRPYRAEDKGQIKAQLGGLSVIAATIRSHLGFWRWLCASVSLNISCQK